LPLWESSFNISRVSRHASSDHDRALGDRDLLDVLLAQYVSVRTEGYQSLSGQLSALSLGAAALAVLITGVATVWAKAPLIASLGLMTVVPATAYFVLVIWATEIKKTLRASSYLRRVAEPGINRLFPDEESGPLTWEGEGYHYGWIVPYYVTIALSLVVVGCLSFAFGAFKFEHAAPKHPSWMWSDWWPVVFGCIAVTPAVVGIVYIVREIDANLRERK
jgi:hypothetical protein